MPIVKTVGVNFSNIWEFRCGRDLRWYQLTLLFDRKVRRPNEDKWLAQDQKESGL